jgi:hypothetical protein
MSFFEPSTSILFCCQRQRLAPKVVWTNLLKVGRHGRIRFLYENHGVTMVILPESQCIFFACHGSWTSVVYIWEWRMSGRRVVAVRSSAAISVGFAEAGSLGGCRSKPGRPKPGRQAVTTCIGPHGTAPPYPSKDHQKVQKNLWYRGQLREKIRNNLKRTVNNGNGCSTQDLEPTMLCNMCLSITGETKCKRIPGRLLPAEILSGCFPSLGEQQLEKNLSKRDEPCNMPGFTTPARHGLAHLAVGKRTDPEVTVIRFRSGTTARALQGGRN